MTVNPYDLMPGDPDLHNLYRSSAMFHQTMDMLANMIEPMVEGLAARCVENETAIAQEAVDVAFTPPRLVLPVDERDPAWREQYEATHLPHFQVVDGEWQVVRPDNPLDG